MESHIDDLSELAIAVLTAMSRRGSAGEPFIRRRTGASPAAIRKALSELGRAGLASSFFGGNTLTARGRRAVHQLEEVKRLDRVRQGTASRHEVSLLADAELRAAVRRVKPRADRQPEPWRLTATFVDPGISEQLDNPNNQIVFGRRGTGKTHVLRVVTDLLSTVENAMVVYVDVRTLGSSTVFEDAERSLSIRTTSLIKDVFEPIHSALLERATSPAATNVDFECLDRLADAITRSILSDERRHIEHTRDSASTDSVSVSLKAGPPFVQIDANATADQRVTERIDREGSPLEHMLFGQIAAALETTLTRLNVDRLYLLLDEWTAVPSDLQPYLAEFLKRSLFIVPRVTVKIAALEYRSSFARPAGRNNVIGFELGADLASNIELDDHFVYDRNTGQTEALFAEVLFRHLSVELAQSTLVNQELLTTPESDPYGATDAAYAPDYLEREYAILDSSKLVDLMFGSKRPFRELVRAGEGVVRDFIGIFATAFDDALRRNLRAIDLAAVREAARRWYATDKEINLDERHRAALRSLSDEVIARGRRRTFMFDRRYEPNETLSSLVDMRVLHLIQRNVLDPTNPTRHYNIYSLDYGLYVDLMGTKYELKPEFGGRKASPDVVPLDNRRYVRGVVIKPDLLAKLSSPDT
jgi:hypothetical protein